jgi:hypothetical protein
MVNGSFRIGGLLELIDELIVRESARQPLSSATILRAPPDERRQYRRLTMTIV